VRHAPRACLNGLRAQWFRLQSPETQVYEDEAEIDAGLDTLEIMFDAEESTAAHEIETLTNLILRVPPGTEDDRVSQHSNRSMRSTAAYMHDHVNSHMALVFEI
jgi:hypothetical protein